MMEEHHQVIAPEMKLGIKVTAFSIISGGRDTVWGLVTLAYVCERQRGRLVRGVCAGLGDSSDVGVVRVGISPTRLLLHKCDDTV